MDNSIYATLSRQSGLAKEMRIVANNIANISTTGFRREGVIFSEHVEALNNNEPSLSMAHATGREITLTQGPLSPTGGMLDFAIEGEGFFMIETPQGNELTRGGSFSATQNGELVTQEGFRVLDAGGGPIFVPVEGQISVARDGTVSSGGAPLAQLGVFVPGDNKDLTHSGGTRFQISQEPLPLEDPVILQGFVEESNVNAISEIARMIEVQRAYEMGQTFLEREDERIRGVISTLNK